MRAACLSLILCLGCGSLEARIDAARVEQPFDIAYVSTWTIINEEI